MIGTVTPAPWAGLGGAEGHVVVGGDNRVDVRIGLQRLLGHRQCLVAGEARRLIEDDLDLGMILDGRLESRRAVDRRGRADLALELDDLATVRQQAQQELALLLATAHVVSADVSERVRAGDVAVDGDDRNTGVDGCLDRRSERLDVLRRDDDAIDALGDRRFEPGRLGGRVVLAVLLDQLDVELVPALSRAMFIMCTKKGKLSPGPRRRSSACRPARPRRGAGQRQSDRAEREASVPASSCVTIRCPRIVSSLSRAARIAGGEPRAQGMAGPEMSRRSHTGAVALVRVPFPS